MSWRNPDARHAGWGMDEYVQAIIDALDAVDGHPRQRRGAPARRLLRRHPGRRCCRRGPPRRQRRGRTGWPRLEPLLVTMLDQSRAGAVGALVDESAAEAAIAASARTGYLDGAARRGLRLAPARRPDLELLGEQLPARPRTGEVRHPVLERRHHADAAGLHRDFVRAAVNNASSSRAGLTMLGAEVDLDQITVDSYVVAGVADHICPWQSCYRSAQLLGGKTRSCCPPAATSQHWSTRRATRRPATRPATTLRLTRVTGKRSAATMTGSWWPDYAAWLAERSGAQVPAPGTLGSERYGAHRGRARQLRAGGVMRLCRRRRERRREQGRREHDWPREEDGA